MITYISSCRHTGYDQAQVSADAESALLVLERRENMFGSERLILPFSLMLMNGMHNILIEACIKYRVSSIPQLSSRPLGPVHIEV